MSDYVMFLNGAASLCHIFKWGRDMKKVGNHCSKRISYSLRSTKVAKFQCRKCINVLRLQLMVTNRETSSATGVFTRFSLCSVLQTLYLCSPNCSSGWTKHDVLATKVDHISHQRQLLKPPPTRFLYWCC